MSRPGEVDLDFAAVVDEVFADHAAAMQADAPLDAADPAFAERLESLGLARLTAPESAGGSGATWREAAVVLRAAARHGIPVPGGRGGPRRRRSGGRRAAGARSTDARGPDDRSHGCRRRSHRPARCRAEAVRPASRRLPGRSASDGRRGRGSSPGPGRNRCRPQASRSDPVHWRWPAFLDRPGPVGLRALRVHRRPQRPSGARRDRHHQGARPAPRDNADPGMDQ
jgi:hypothetical protein